MSEMRQEMRQEIRQEASEIREEMSEMRGELGAEIHGTASSITRQMYVALVGQMAVLLGVAYFFVTHVAA
jgi:hypothetical protein